MADKFSRIVADLTTQSWSCAPDFLSHQVIDGLVRHARKAWRAGDFKKAGVGHSAGYVVRPDIRGDYIRWLDETASTPCEQDFRAEIEALRETLNRELFLGLAEFEAHFALYPPGTRYEAHVDRFAASPERTISVVFYLNQDWARGDGGELRVYPPDEPENPVDIRPTAGTLVVFRSEIVRHEVLPAARERLSLTGWLRRRAHHSTF